MGDVNSKPDDKQKAAKIKSIPKPDENDKVIEETGGKEIISFSTNQNFSQELSVFPELVWKKILSYVTEPEDVLSLLNTSPYFHHRVKELQLFYTVIPLLMKEYRLNSFSSFECRLLNKKTQQVVDTTFREINRSKKSHGFISPPTHNVNFNDGPYCFIDEQKLNRFTAHFEGIATASLSESLFFKDHVKIWVSNAPFFDQVIQMLPRFGPLIRKLELNMNFINIPGTLMERLIMVLNHVPNLESLIFNFKPFPLTGLDVIVPNRGRIGVEQSVRMPLPEEMPRLPRLMELEISHLLNQDGRNQSSSLVLEGFCIILKAYGQQLSKLSCRDVFFTLRIPVDGFSEHLTNLKELTFYGLSGSIIRIAFHVLSQLQLPKLSRLNLDLPYGNGNWGSTFMPQEFIAALNNLRDSLEELVMWRAEEDNPTPFQLEGQMQLVDTIPMALTLPKLKFLSLHPPDLNSNLWNVFETQFINLEHVEFQITQDSNAGSDEETLPSFIFIRNFFNMFQKLSKFSWAETIISRVFTTEISRKECQMGEKRVSVKPVRASQRWRRSLSWNRSYP